MRASILIPCILAFSMLSAGCASPSSSTPDTGASSALDTGVSAQVDSGHPDSGEGVGAADASQPDGGEILQDGGSLRPGNITFLWSFPGSQTCAQVGAPAAAIHIGLIGARGAEQLDSNGWYWCTIAGTDGISLTNFAGGDYTYTVDAYDAARTAKSYAAHGALTVDGDVQVDVTLAAVP
ncbi:MAG TPA: hypothetical protein VGK67_33550 [Myxococcales bacterium]|jgi:hypothetical protein